MSDIVQYSVAGRTASAIATSVEEGLRQGRIVPGQRLPPVRRLAKRLGVSPATVASAYGALRTRGFVTSQGRLGTRVSPRPPVASPLVGPVPPHLRNLADGNPDPALLPDLRPVLRRLDGSPRLYGGDRNSPELLALATRLLRADGIPADRVAVVGGALDGIERVLEAQLRPGDRIAVEDPGYSAVLDLVAALGLGIEPVPVDEKGPRPEALRRALARGALAFLLTPRAQNPTGAALDERRARELQAVLVAFPQVLVLEDDHAGEVAGAPAVSLAGPRRARWAVVRSMSKGLGPDLRVAFLAGDDTTLGRVEGRQALGTGWVSQLLQGIVLALLQDPATAPRLAAAAGAYARSREALVEALARRKIASAGRSGMNVWIPVPEEVAVVTSLAEAGWAVRAGERYRIHSPAAIRVTVSRLDARDAARLADDLAVSLTSGARTRPA